MKPTVLGQPGICGSVGRVAERAAGDRMHVDAKSVPQELEVPAMMHGGMTYGDITKVLQFMAIRGQT